MFSKETNKKIAVNRWQKKHKAMQKRIDENSIRYPEVKARIIGYLIGDGSVFIRKEKRGTMRYEFSFYPDNVAMLNSFLDSISLFYGLTPKPRIEKNYFQVKISNKAIVEDLLRQGEFKSTTWSIPSLSSEKEIEEFLRAYFDCEAYVSRQAIRVESVNKVGLIHVKQLLLQFGISSKMYQYERKNKNWNTNHILCIFSYENRKRFLTKIGFYHSKKQEKLVATVV